MIWKASSHLRAFNGKKTEYFNLHELGLFYKYTYYKYNLHCRLSDENENTTTIVYIHVNKKEKPKEEIYLLNLHYPNLIYGDKYRHWSDTSIIENNTPFVLGLNFTHVFAIVRVGSMRRQSPESHPPGVLFFNSSRHGLTG